MAHDRLINDLFAKEDRPLVTAWENRCTHGWREDQVVATLHEFASPAANDSGEYAVQYMTDFMRNIGIPEYQVQPFGAWIDRGAPGWEPVPTSASAEVAAEEPIPAAPAVPPVQTGPSRETLQAQIRQHEANMRAPQGSEQWNSYWRNGGDAEYRGALEALETAAPSAAEPSV